MTTRAMLTFSFYNRPNQNLMQNLNSELESNLRVKWMIACGGSWAWEAANLLEHLERRLPLRVQVQNPFQYCQGLQPFNDPLTYVERVQRLMELPSLDTENVDGNAADGNATYAYSLPFPQGTRFVQDDVVIYHRDWFRASNWNNWAVQRPRYAIGRFMNEVSGVHARVVQQCNMLDEVWVPSKHHVEIYASAGVERSKLVVVPESIDPNIFDPKSVEPLMLPK